MMYDTEMKLNHQIVHFVESQMQTLVESMTESDRGVTGVNAPYQPSQHADSHAMATILTAMETSLQQYMEGLRAISCLLQKGFVSQTRGIFQTLGDDYEEMIFLSLPSQNGQLSNLHRQYLETRTDQDGLCGLSPLSRCEMRNMIRKATHINHNVFQLYPKKQALEVLRPHAGKPCLVEVAIELHKHFAYKGVLLAVLLAKVAGDEAIMRACLNYRAHLEMIDPLATKMEPQVSRSKPEYVPNPTLVASAI
ncbi:hypothetical protein [Photobacterium ganghwense]|uniref:hypothetical protein n=1 Tax=Photobacterium ganghwense TaxID=320778 RepID=UPI001C2CF177|nr:hypothetical protein [Photobacterium ganghwense]MBV1842530.1 hypothetical protein [Photobacterium ganghwense]